MKQKWIHPENGRWKTDSTLRVECGKHRIHIIIELAKYLSNKILFNHVNYNINLFHLNTAHTNDPTSGQTFDTTIPPILITATKGVGKSLYSNKVNTRFVTC